MTTKPSYEELERRVQELEKIESELEYSKEMLQVYEKASLGYQSLDENGHYITVNQNWLDTLGYAKEEVIGKSFADFIHPDWRHHFKENFSRFKSIGEILGAEFEMVKKNGDLILVSLTGKISRDKKGDFHQTHCIFHDIADRKRVEEELRENEGRYRILFEHTAEALFVAQDARIVFQNPRSIELLGYSAEEFQSKSFFHFIHEDDREMVTDHHIRRLKGEKLPERYNFRIIHKDGSILWTELNAVLFQWNGRPAVLCFMTDITERRHVEHELKRNEKLYRTLFSDSLTPIFMVDEKSRSYIDANQAALDFLECNIEQLIGKSVYDFTPPENLKQTQKKHANFSEIKSLETHYQVNGKIKILLLQVTPLELDGDTILIGIGQDITERKQAEIERNKLQGKLSQVQKMESIGSLAGGIAHDFNNLLFPIVGLSEMMLNDFPPDSMERKNIQEIFRAGTRGKELVQQILSFSRQSEHHKIPVHIQKILKEVLKLCRVTIPADIAITPDIQIDCTPVMADPTQIHQIAMNLITNAYHAVESTGGTITVQLKETDFLSKDDPTLNMTSGRYAVLSISDTGTGIDTAIIKKIFDPYFTTKEKGKGTGLGLATVYGIIKAHGGDIKVHSEVGRGSSFNVYLPLLEKTQESEPEKEKIPHPTGTEHILLVDDETSIVHLQKQMLERLGYQTSIFTGSRNALAAFKTESSRFDLVITDMNMPHLNGMQLAEELAAIRSDIPVIICTGFSERINREKSEAIGIKGFLMKPVAKSEMAEMVRKVLDQTKDSPQK